ncbi:ABC transporter permease [Microbacterium sp. KSW4-17]|uniref:ABC transporter permease n=1 Tax=Microbacterium galbum TaxID=3075994 RepID=A0ABU3T4I8_9MICO|nr:ABC transporter permease [Microbacterium sp. KSW4-17]MDU0366245.1 ABC transporter permease [Microbacterium sp. KSW4-17]
MNLHRLGTIVGVDLRQRVRSVAWYVLLGVFALILLGLLLLSFASFALWSGGDEWFFSIVIMLVLLLVLLVSPTLSGSAVNGDRDAATLAPVQVTLVTTGEIVIGKFLAAWISGLAFLVVAVPFLLVSTFAGGLNPLVILSSLAILVVEIGIVAAMGVGLSAIVARPLFSVASTYLIVAALTIGTLLVFGLGATALRTSQEVVTRDFDFAAVPDGCDPFATSSQNGCPSAGEIGCVENTSYTDVPRFDRVWWVLAANPFVILADATPPTYDPDHGSPSDLFSQIAYGVRMAQIAPEPRVEYDSCATYTSEQVPDYTTPAQQIEGTAPSWFVGLLVQIVVAGGLLAWGTARTRTPARRLPPGTRIA